MGVYRKSVDAFSKKWVSLRLLSRSAGVSIYRLRDAVRAAGCELMAIRPKPAYETLFIARSSVEAFDFGKVTKRDVQLAMM